jgi:hypothetical protein
MGRRIVLQNSLFREGIWPFSSFENVPKFEDIMLSLLSFWRNIFLKDNFLNIEKSIPSRVWNLFLPLFGIGDPFFFSSEIICAFWFWRTQYSRDSSVGIALGYKMDDWGSSVRFPAGAGNLSLHYRVQNGSGAHPASYPMGTRGSFPGCKAGGTWSWPLTSTLCRGHRMRGSIPPLPNTPSWRGA